MHVLCERYTVSSGKVRNGTFFSGEFYFFVRIQRHTKQHRPAERDAERARESTKTPHVHTQRMCRRTRAGVIFQITKSNTTRAHERAHTARAVSTVCIYIYVFIHLSARHARVNIAQYAHTYRHKSTQWICGHVRKYVFVLSADYVRRVQMIHICDAQRRESSTLAHVALGAMSGREIM